MNFQQPLIASQPPLGKLLLFHQSQRPCTKEIDENVDLTVLFVVHTQQAHLKKVRFHNAEKSTGNILFLIICVLHVAR